MQSMSKRSPGELLPAPASKWAAPRRAWPEAAEGPRRRRAGGATSSSGGAEAERLAAVGLSEPQRRLPLHDESSWADQGGGVVASSSPEEVSPPLGSASAPGNGLDP